MRTTVALALASLSKAQLLLPSDAENDLFGSVSAGRPVDLGEPPNKKWSPLELSVTANGTYGSVVGPHEVCANDAPQYSGRLPAGDGAEYFFWLAMARNPSVNESPTPLIVWMTGGPGCSSSLALLSENGPCTVIETGGDDFWGGDKTLKTKKNAYSWNEAAHVVWVDQPGGVGFSDGPQSADETQVARHMLAFLRSFFKEFPTLRASGLYIWGESYAGHYVSSVAAHVFRAVQAGEPMNLAGAAIGNGLVNPAMQFGKDAEMAYTGGDGGSLGHGVIDKAAYEKMEAELPACLGSIATCQEQVQHHDPEQAANMTCYKALMKCMMKEMMPIMGTGLNRYDLRKECGSNPLCYNFDPAKDFLSSSEVRTQLGVGFDVAPWQVCNVQVTMPFIMSGDYLSNSEHYVKELLEGGVPVLVYAGDTDFVCNWVGGKAWTTALAWKHGKQFGSAADEPWMVDGAAHGRQRTAGNFTFLQIYNAGHMVPMDQPRAALEMVRQFTSASSAWKVSLEELAVDEAAVDEVAVISDGDEASISFAWLAAAASASLVLVLVARSRHRSQSSAAGTASDEPLLTA